MLKPAYTDTDSPEGNLSREQSVQIQGIAILFMIWHHFFLNPLPYGREYFLFPLQTLYFSWFARITIAMYSFVSGYGMYVVLSHTKQRLKACLKRAGVLYLRHWLGLALLVLLPMWLLGEPVQTRSLVRNITAIDPDWNGAMWYVFQYLVHMLAAPLLWMLFCGEAKEKRRAVTGLFTAGVLCGGAALFVPGMRGVLSAVQDMAHPTMFAVFPAGFLCARYDVFARLKEKLPSSSALRVLTGIMLCAVSFLARMRLLKVTENARFDVLIAPVFVFGLTLLLERIPRATGRVLTWLGNRSTWLWIAHIPVYGRTKEYLMPLGSAMPFFLAEMALIIPVALLLASVWNLLSRAVQAAGGRK